VLCTNANHRCVRELYSGGQFTFKVVSRPSRISADAATRGSYEELVIRANI
jgi:hypothetical protein